MVFVHTAVGAAASYIFANKGKFTDNQKSKIYFLGIIGSTFPDFDVLYMLFFPETHHRYFLTHSIIPYLILYLVLFLILRKSTKFKKTLNKVFFIGVLTHLIMDFFFGGLTLLSPLSSLYLGFKINFPGDRLNWALSYMQSKYMLFEFSLLIPFILLWKKEKNIVFRQLPIFFIFIAAFMLGLLSFS